MPGTDDKYLALFNTGETAATVTAALAEMGLNGATCVVRDLWAKRDEGRFSRQFGVELKAHAAGLYRLQVLPG